MSLETKKRQTFETIKPSQLLDRVKALKADGFVFYQACGTMTMSGVEIVYLFDKNDEDAALKIVASKRSKVESISFIYPVAAVYEEEIADEFAINIKHIDTEGRMRFAGADAASARARAGLSRVNELLKEGGNDQVLRVMERMDGRCSFGTSLGFCRAVERAMDIDVPARARYIRVVLLELSRIQAHLLALARTAEAVSLDRLAMNCLRVREQVLAACEALTGSRIIHDNCKIGGLESDIDDRKLNDAVESLTAIGGEIETLEEDFCEDRFLNKVLSGLNYLSYDEADRSHAVGIWAKAAGVARDSRSVDSGVYFALGFEPVTDSDGDCMARVRVRLAEIRQSLELICSAVELMPDGDICNDEKSRGYDSIVESAVKTELPDGEAMFYVRGSRKGSIKDITVRMPSYVNNFALAELLKGGEGTADELF